MSRVVIVDYKLGNLFSVKNACEKIGLNVVISNDPTVLIEAEALILPGVGAFQEAMGNLRALNLIDPIQHHVSSGKPFFGICLGLQLLFSESDEFGIHKGLDIIKGKVKKIPSDIGGVKIPVPQIGWNTIKMEDIEQYNNSPLNEILEDDFTYFVHSYYVDPVDNKEVLSKTNYGGLTYCSSVLKNNIFATQFHPEKSGEKGLKIYQNWAKSNNLI